MSRLHKLVLSQLQELSHQAPSLNETHQLAPDTLYNTTILGITTSTTMIDLTLEFSDIARYSMMLCRLDVQARAEARIDDRAVYLHECADDLIRRLSYLEEPLAVYELDADVGMVILRSSPPDRDGEQRTYWEVRLSISAAPLLDLARYCWAPGMAERERLAYPATFALVGRLAESVCAIFDRPEQ